MASTPSFRAEIIVPDGDAVVLALYGDLDTYSAPEFKSLLLNAVNQDTQRVIVDLTDVSLLDSTALGVLLCAAKRAHRGRLAVVCSDERVIRVFAAVGLDGCFLIFATRAAALAAD